MKKMNISDFGQTINEYAKIYKITDFEHFFNVYEDKNGNYTFNLNSTIYFKFNKQTLPKYLVKYKSFWPLLSYNIYSTPRLAWFLMKLNDVKPSDVFKPIEVGTKILYVNQDTMQQIVAGIN